MLSATCIFNVRTDGQDSNGGGFNSAAAGVDRSLQAAAHCLLTSASVVHTTTTQINVDAGDYTVTADDVGNVVQIIGGSATAGFYEITAADTGNNRWTLDRSAGTAGQTVQAKMGGALGSIGGYGYMQALGGQAGIKCNVKVGSYTINTTTINVTGGPFKDTLGGIDAGNQFEMHGYDATPGDQPTAGNRPVIALANSLTAAEIAIIDYEGSAKKFTSFGWIDLDGGTGNAQTIGIRLQTNEQYITHTKIIRTSKYGIVIWDYNEFVSNFEIANFSGVGVQGLFSAATSPCQVTNGSIHDGAAGSYGLHGYPACPDTIEYLAIWNVGTGLLLDHSVGAKNCTVANCTTHGLYLVDRGSAVTNDIENVLFYGCGTALFRENGTSVGAAAQVRHCAFGNNGTDLGTGWTTATQTNNVTLSGDPFLDLAGGDLNLDTATADGLACTDTGTGGEDIGAYAAEAPDPPEPPADDEDDEGTQIRLGYRPPPRLRFGG